MFVQQYLRLARRASVVLAVGMLALIASWHGWFDWTCSCNVQSEIEAAAKRILKYYNDSANKWWIDVVFLAGSVLAPASFLLLKWALLLDRRLPKAIFRYIGQRDECLQSARHNLHELVADRAAEARERSLAVFTGPLDRAMAKYGLGSAIDAELILARTMTAIQNKLATAEDYVAALKKEKTTAFLLQSLIEINKEGSAMAGGGGSSARLLSAEGTITTALSLRDDDLEAFELRALVRKRLGNRDGAIADYSRMRELADSQKDILRSARSTRSLVELSEPRNQQARRDLRRLIEDGIASLGSGRDGSTLSDEMKLELGALHYLAAVFFTTKMPRKKLRAVHIDAGRKSLEKLTGASAEKLRADISAL